MVNITITIAVTISKIAPTTYINKVINNAKVNRKEIDELEEKRNLKKDEYNITKNIDLKNVMILRKLIMFVEFIY